MTRYANQGVKPWTLVEVFGSYIQLVLNFEERLVRMWWGESRPHLEGQDFFVWYTLASDAPSKSKGPGRWGNRSDLRFEVHLLSRSFQDRSQVDIERAKPFYEAYWKLEQAFQGLNLFDQYSAPIDIPTQGIWHPPEPLPTAVPYTVEPMYIEDLPKPNKTQREEGTSEAGFIVIAPVVLALSIP